MTDRLRYVPLTDRDWLRPGVKRREALFTATYPATVKLLLAEVDMIATTRGGLITIGLDVLPAALKVDGSGLKAKQSPATPAVTVGFETKHGPVVFRSDAYRRTWGPREPWRDNVRAVALTLEHLRAVDRYGAADSGQQYGGFLAIEAGTGATALGGMTHDAARAVLRRHSERDHGDMATLYRWARVHAHPDRHNGDRTAWDEVEQAAKILRLT